MTDLVGAVSDAGPIIHLDELGCIDLLQDFGPAHVPMQVISEVKRHRPHLDIDVLDAFVPTPVSGIFSVRLQALANALDLHTGEMAALSLLLEGRGAIFLTDDSGARLAGESLGFRVHGTIGVLVRAIRRGTRTRSEVIAALRSIPERTTLYVSRGLLDDVISRVSAR
jgi:predicted nucleic acid-binding protein